MARKHKHPEHENLERWLVSYADFITLLFATFTALYALSLSDVNKLKEVAQAVREGFAEQSIISGIKSILTGQSPPSENPDPIASEKGAGPGVVGKFDSMTYKPGEIKSLQEFTKDLMQDIQSMNGEIQDANDRAALYTGTAAGQGGEDAATPVREIEAAVQERGIRVSFDSRMLFGPGTAMLRREGYPFLDSVAKRLKKFDGSNIIHIEGHTDDIPISTGTYPSNWELSGARASSVVRYLIGKHSFTPQSLVAVGYGDSQPLTSNKTPEGRAKNRRVDVIIYTQTVSKLVNPRLQYIKEAALETRTEQPKPREIVPALPDPHTPSTKDPKGTTAKPIPPQEGPVRVIIKEKDGTERIFIPKTTKQEPAKTEPDIKKTATTETKTTSKSGQRVGKQVIETQVIKPIQPIKH